MEEKLAAKLLIAALALDHAFGELDKLVSAIPNDSERRAYAKSLGDIIGAVNDNFIRPIVRQFPHLENDRTS